MATWHTTESARAEWLGAPPDAVLQRLLDVSQAEVLAYAPAGDIPSDDAGSAYVETGAGGTMIFTRDGADTVVHVISSGVALTTTATWPEAHAPYDYLESGSPSGRATVTVFSGGLIQLSNASAGAPEYWSFSYPSQSTGGVNIPEGHRWAHLQHARNIWNAQQVSPTGRLGGGDDDSFVLTPFPMDWAIKARLRPHAVFGGVVG